MGKPHVIYRQNIPSPYFVDRFNELARRSNIRIEAWFDSEREPDRSWDVEPKRWEFAHRFITPQPLSASRLVWKSKPDVFITLYDGLSFSAGVIAARGAGAKVVLRVLKTFDAWRSRSRAKELAKHFIFRAANAVHTTGPDGEAYARSYGARRVFAFAEPVDVARFHCADGGPGVSQEARRALGLRGCVFLYVGRLWEGKGLDFLLDAYRQLRAQGIEASLLIVGDGVDAEKYKAKASNLQDVIFKDFVQQFDLPEFYHLADVFVFPTLGDPYGHVVHEAMAASLPVISTSNAGDISQRVVDGQSGFIVAAADAAALHDRMRVLAMDTRLREGMGARGFEIVRPRTIEWWCGQFENMVYTLVEREAS